MNKRLNSRNRRIAPALIGAGVSTLGNLAGIFGANAQAKKQQEMMLEQFWNNKELEDANILSEYDTSGIGGIQYYANGGNLNKLNPSKYTTTGGDLVPIADGVTEVVGNTHGENTIDGTYGVQLQQQGKPVAEVEDGEVIADDTAVFSNRLMYNKKQSYADKMKQIAAKRNKLDSKLEGTVPTRTRNTIERELAGLNMAEEALYNTQEAHKMEEGIAELSKLANGGRIPTIDDFLFDDLINKPGYSGGDTANRRILKDANSLNMRYANLLGDDSLVNPPLDYVSSIPNTPAGVTSTEIVPTAGSLITPTSDVVNAPATVAANNPSDFLSGNAPMFIDNLANAAINLVSPRVPRPILSAAPRINTRINVAPRVSSVTNAVNSITDNITGNTSNSSIARANVANARLRGAEMLSGIYADKENTENSLENQQEQLRYANRVSNANLLNNTNMLAAQNQAGNLRRVGSNFANLAEDIETIQTRNDLDKYYDEDLLNQLLNDTTGEKLRTVRKSPYIMNRLKRAGLTNLLNS